VGPSAYVIFSNGVERCIELDSYQCNNNTIVLLATQHKNDNTISWEFCTAVSGGLALLRAFCEWQIEHQVRRCCKKGLILRNMAGREKGAGRLYESGYKQ